LNFKWFNSNFLIDFGVTLQTSDILAKKTNLSKKSTLKQQRNIEKVDLHW